MLSKRIGFQIIFLLLLMMGSSKIALAQSSIEARVDRTNLGVDEQLLLTVTLTGDFSTLPNPDLSGLQDFAVVSSSTSRQVSIVNGQMSSEGVFSYVLQPLREGALIIPSISVTVEGQIYQTDAIEIMVQNGGSPPTPNENVPSATGPESLVGQDLFVEAEVNNPTPYLGEQFLYTFRFFQAVDYPVNFGGRLDYQAPSFTDFWSQTLSQPQYTAQVNGRTYTVTEVRTALFPAGLNEITIEPARLVVPGGLFNPDVVLETLPLIVDVRSLPSGAPPDFNGAVGQFELRASLNTTESQVNDTVTLELEIEGEGNIEALTEPVLPEIPNWRFFESQPSVMLDPREDKVFGIRRFERLMVPGQPGDYIIPAIGFSYYDPEVDEYRTSTTRPIPITILPGEGDFDDLAEPIDIAAGELRDLKPVPASLEGSFFFSLLNPLYWFCWIVPLFVIGTIWIFQTQRQRLITDTGYARRLRAKRIAHKILTNAQQHQGDGYAATQRAVLGYLSDKLNRPTAGLTTDNLIKLLVESKLDPTLIERIKGILGQIEISRFAPIEEAATQSLLAETKQLIDDLERFFGKR